MKNTAEIITIGDEILIGQIVDTNSAWIAQHLNNVGIKIYQITSVSDKHEHILQALSDAQNRAGLVIITGGLGPTKDDITKKVLCDYFETKLVLSEKSLENIKFLLKQRGIAEINKNNREQAMVPENCKLLTNSEGTAPGMWFEKQDTIFVSIPGVPFEMKTLMLNHILPELKTKFNSKVIVHKVVMTQGSFEAKLAEILEEWEEGLKEKNIKLAYLPQPGIIRLRLSAEGENEKQIRKNIEEEIKKLNKIIPEYIYGYDEEKIEEVVGKIAKQHNKTISTAESCTGGNIAQLLTSVPGSSLYFTGSVVAYSNEIKQNILKVPENDIIKHGAVSKQVVEKMATGIMKLYNTDYSIATSGIAGPDGGTNEKPVGTTWIAVCSNNKVISESFLFGDNRERNIRKTSVTALNILRKLIVKEMKIK